jgi:nucleoside 2-deoxyribosyltransferase
MSESGGRRERGFIMGLDKPMINLFKDKKLCGK